MSHTSTHTPADLPTLLMMRVKGMRMKVTTVSLQLAANMKKSTTTAWVKDRIMTFRLRHTWSDTVVVSADSRLLISPGVAARKSEAGGHIMRVGAGDCVVVGGKGKQGDGREREG